MRKKREQPQTVTCEAGMADENEAAGKRGAFIGAEVAAAQPLPARTLRRRFPTPSLRSRELR